MNIQSSKDIWQQALSKHPNPYAVVLALSGGDDSRATYFAAKAIGIPITHILHIDTGTGIPQTTEWVRWFSTEYVKLPYIEGSAGDRYKKRVLTKGFPGRGRKAHEIMFHLLKGNILTRELSAHIRQRRRNRIIFLLNGARLSESANRAKNFASTPVRPDAAGSSNVWVNLLQHWTKDDCHSICLDNKAPRNPVAKQLCRSGECMCGTMQSHQSRVEAATVYPEWGKKLDLLESEVTKKFPWGWGDDIPKSWANEKAGQLRLFSHDSMQPMCSSCLASDSPEVTL